MAGAFSGRITTTVWAARERRRAPGGAWERRAVRVEADDRLVPSQRWWPNGGGHRTHGRPEL